MPIAMPLTFLVIMLIRLAKFGVPAPEADEGILAHLFQIWIVLEVLMVLYFAIKWIPQMPKQALFILTLQIAAALSVLVPVFLLKL